MADTIKTALKDKTLEDLVVVKEKPAKTEPKLTKAKVEECIGLLKEIEKNNGHLGVAKECGLSVTQVAEIHGKMKERIAELQYVAEDVKLAEVTK